MYIYICINNKREKPQEVNTLEAKNTTSKKMIKIFAYIEKFFYICIRK